MTDLPVLFIHGFPLDHFMWRHQLAALARRQCIAPDLRGAGTSGNADPVDAYSMATYAADLIRALDDHRVDRVAVCGLSMGGYIAFELLRQVPERVAALVLCNTKATADAPEAKLGRVAMAAKAQREGAPAIAEELIPKLLSPATRARQSEVVDEVRDMVSRQPVSGIVGALRALRERPDSTPLLATIRIPVLVVAGTDDQITPAAGMQDMAGAIPGAQLSLIPEAGHLPPLEQPVALSGVLKDFLARVR